MNAYRHVPTADLIAAIEVNRLDLASIDTEPETWQFPIESRLFVIWHLAESEDELKRRKRLSASRFAPAWPDPRRELDDLRAAIDIQTLVERLSGAEFGRAGRRRWTTCPLPDHVADESPSFSVSVDRGLFYCFGCGRGGDCFRFAALFLGVDFRAAVDAVANAAGVQRVLPFPTRAPTRRVGVMAVG